MKRRTFLQSLSAAFGAAALGRHFTAAQQFRSVPVIDYSLFCEPWGSCRHDISKPWESDGSIVATDARVLITHSGHVDSDGLDLRLPDISKLRWGEFDKPGWKRLHASPVVIKAGGNGYPGTCPQCHGRGCWPSKLCDVCEGEGEYLEATTIAGIGDEVMEIEAYNTCTNPKCRDGYAGPRCTNCSGKGEVALWRESIDGRPFAISYVNKLRTLGDVDYRLADDLLVVRFGDDGKGMLMGVKER